MKTNTSAGKMRIVQAPSGQAPPAIRSEWIGVEIPFLEFGMPSGTVRGAVDLKKVSTNEVFVVDQTEALEALRKKSPHAADWWKNMGFPVPNAQFTFNRECAEIIN